MPPSSHPAPLHASLPLNDITGCVLAGGRGMRMGGIDKGLQPFLGQPLAAHALDRLAPQVGHLLINANRHAEAYAQLGAAHGADRKSTRLNSSHSQISYAVFCLK